MPTIPPRHTNVRAILRLATATDHVRVHRRDVRQYLSLHEAGKRRATQAPERDHKVAVFAGVAEHERKQRGHLTRGDALANGPRAARHGLHAVRPVDDDQRAASDGLDVVHSGQLYRRVHCRPVPCQDARCGWVGWQRRWLGARPTHGRPAPTTTTPATRASCASRWWLDQHALLV